MTDKFTRPILRDLRISLEDILRSESKSDKIPFELTLGNCSFEEDKATFKLVVTFKGNSIQDIERKKQKEDLEYYAKYFDLDLNRKHSRYTLIGYKVDQMYWDFDRLSSSGQETLDKIANKLGMETTQDVENRVNKEIEELKERNPTWTREKLYSEALKIG